MARIRSPNYPAISLAEALKRIEQVHGRERQHPASREVIIKGMGYNGVHGTSLGAISAAIKYGLLEQKGKGGDYRVSDRAVAILHPHNPEEKASALREAARSPALFQELLEHFKGDLPSDDNLRAYLVRRGFSQSSLPDFIQAFRDTMELVPEESGEHTAAEPDESIVTGRNYAGSVTPLKTKTLVVPMALEGNVSQSQVSIHDERIEVAAVLFDQDGVQKVIDRLNAIKALLPEKQEKKEAAN